MTLHAGTQDPISQRKNLPTLRFLRSGVILGTLILSWILSSCIKAPPLTFPLSPPALNPPTPNVVTPAAAPTAPDFTLTTLEGETVHLSDYRGQIVLLNFWASWCPPCNEELPALNAYYAAHKDQGLVLLGVDVDETADVVRDFVQQKGITYPILLDPQGKASADYSVTGMPTTFIIDREGRLIGYWPGELTEAMLEKGLTPLLTP